MAGTLVTAGGLVFTGRLTGEFMAVDADTGKTLWEFQTSAGIVGQPITWERDGKQYVTVTNGATGPYVMRAGDPNLANVPAGGSIWTFKIFGVLLEDLEGPDAAAGGNVGDRNLAHVPGGGSIWTFKIFEEYSGAQRAA